LDSSGSTQFCWLFVGLSIGHSGIVATPRGGAAAVIERDKLTALTTEPARLLRVPVPSDPDEPEKKTSDENVHQENDVGEIEEEELTIAIQQSEREVQRYT
jgi:hypothetical protein